MIDYDLAIYTNPFFLLACFRFYKLSNMVQIRILGLICFNRMVLFVQYTGLTSDLQAKFSFLIP